MSEAVEEVIESTERFTCPRCRAYSHHVRESLTVAAWSGTYKTSFMFNDGPGAFRVDGTGVKSAGPGTGSDWDVTVCASCNLPSVWRGEQLLYPRSSTIPASHPEMPQAARSLYDEARQVFPDSRRASAALARAALESLLLETDQSGRKKNLQTRIGELKGKVNEPLWQVLTAPRILGNDSLHGGEDDLVVLYLDGNDAEIVEAIFGAVNALVEELITQPRKARALYELIPEAKRSAAEEAGADR
ncbi:DUF4145 domain-containing protein [Agromyces sp. GXS1127]|uniref:DUF4145 domain-containing protein n=1 Tax=Agromyces sp. GXS1127 TaxID=3424181 RepID=UPI003D31147E